MSFIPEKMNSIERALIAAASMSAPDARNVLRLICEGGMTTTVALNEPSEGDRHYAKREKFIKRMKSSTDRVLDYARHETLRKIEKHFRETPIKSGDQTGHEFRGNQWTGGIYYHGTGKDFSEFNPAGKGKAIHFTSDESNAMRYAGISTRYTGETAKIVRAQIRVGRDATERVKQLQHLLPSEMHEQLKREGFDAYRDGDGVVVLNHKAIKILKHFRDNPGAIQSAEGDDTPSLAARLTFDRPTFKEELLAALAEDQAAALAVSGQQLFDEIGKDSVWRLPSQDAIQFIQDRANLLANVPDEVHSEIMQSIEQGLEGGESRKQLMARITSFFDEIRKGRAETIANTETAAAFNYARDKAMREAGVTHKRWLHSQSPLIKEPRPTHVEADGQIQPIDDPFDVGGVQFMRPADDSLGAGPEDIINCHCVAIPVEAPIESGEGEGHPFRGNQYTSGEASTLLKESLTPKAAAVGIPPISHNEMGSAYQFESIRTPLNDSKPRVQSKLIHEFGHHVDRVKQMSSTPEFNDVVRKSMDRAKNFTPRDTGNVAHISQRVSGENEELLKSSLLKTPFGQSLQTHGKDYLDKFQNKEVFAIGFGEHQRANSRFREHFPELHAYMEKHFGE